MYLLPSFCEALLQGHILSIPDLDTPTGLSPLLTPPSSDGPENSQQHAMWVQVLLAMGQERLSKDESGDLLEQWFHVVTITQELCHITRNFVWVSGGYLSAGGPLS